MTHRGFADADPVRHSASAGAGAEAEGAGDYAFRNPGARDAAAVSALVAGCPPLDPNSLYCNLLQCSHFAATCLLAERDGSLDGWVSGYRPPDDPDAMFVWQVAVAGKARGRGLGIAMLDALCRLPAVADATRLITTVTPSNRVSRAMFAAFARRQGAALTVRSWFDRECHFGGRHESEELITIGPLSPRRTRP